MISLRQNKNKTMILGILVGQRKAILIFFNLNPDSIDVDSYEIIENFLDQEDLIEKLTRIIINKEKNDLISFKKVIFFTLISQTNLHGDLKRDTHNLFESINRNLDLEPLGFINLKDVFVNNQDYFLSNEVIYCEFLKDHFNLFFFEDETSYSKTFFFDQEDLWRLEFKRYLQKPKTILVSFYESKKQVDNFFESLSKAGFSFFNKKIVFEHELVKTLNNLLSEHLGGEFVSIFDKYSETKVTSRLDHEKNRTDFGFLINEDISEQLDLNSNNNRSLDQQHESILLRARNKLKKNSIILLLLNKTFYNLNNFKNILYPNKIIFSLTKNKLTFFFFFLGVFFILGFSIVEIFFHRVKVSLVYNLSPIKEELKIEVPYRISTSSGIISEKVSTSGEKLIGERASGEVTVFNTNLSREKNFPKGFPLKFNSLIFLLEEDIKIPSASSAINPGQIKSRIRAKEIGEEYNIPKGTKINIDETSYAEVISNLSGGKKETVRVVSKDDYNYLEQIINKKLNEIFDKNFSKKGELLVKKLSQAKFVKKNFSKELGEQAEVLNVNASYQITKVTIDEDILKDIIIKSLKRKLKPIYSLDEGFFEINLKEAEFNAAKINALAVIDGYPKINTNKKEISRLLRGKKFEKVDSVLKEEFFVDDYQIQSYIKNPFFDFMPFFSDNIDVKIIEKKVK